jgi:excalibur calcium-binding domain-containing protein
MRLLSLVAVALIAVAVASVASAKIPPLYKSCAALNAKYAHGIGRAHAHDKTSGTPVTTFTRSDRLYRIAMSHNRGLDRDKDGIACEKA